MIDRQFWAMVLIGGLALTAYLNTVKLARGLRASGVYNPPADLTV